jgi:hypothetical protein
MTRHCAPTSSLACSVRKSKPPLSMRAARSFPFVEGRQVARIRLIDGSSSGSVRERRVRNRPGWGLAGASVPAVFDVLLVEDDAGDALLVGEALGKVGGEVRLHVVADGTQALALLRR